MLHRMRGASEFPASGMRHTTSVHTVWAKEPHIVTSTKSRAERKASDDEARASRAWAEHEFALQKRDEQTARLRAQRLAKEAAARDGAGKSARSEPDD